MKDSLAVRFTITKPWFVCQMAWTASGLSKNYLGLFSHHKIQNTVFMAFGTSLDRPTWAVRYIYRWVDVDRWSASWGRSPSCPSGRCSPSPPYAASHTARNTSPCRRPDSGTAQPPPRTPHTYSKSSYESYTVNLNSSLTMKYLGSFC